MIAFPRGQQGSSAVGAFLGGGRLSLGHGLLGLGFGRILGLLLGILRALGKAVFLAGIAIPGIVCADECQRFAASIAGILFPLLLYTVSRGVSSRIGPNVIIFLVFNCDIARLDTAREMRTKNRWAGAPVDPLTGSPVHPLTGSGATAVATAVNDQEVV